MVRSVRLTLPSQLVHAAPIARSDTAGVQPRHSITAKRFAATAAVSVALLGACGRGGRTVSPSSAANPVATSQPSLAASPAPASSPVVTTPDLSDVDAALAAIDADMANADRDATNEGAPAK